MAPPESPIQSPVSYHSTDSLPPGPRVPLPGLKAELREVAKNRGTPYASKRGLIVYYETDDSKAFTDARSLQTTFQDVLSIQSEIYKIPKHDRNPAWNLNLKIRSLTDPMKINSPGDHDRHLFAFAYIGHGSRDLDSNNDVELRLVSGSGQEIEWQGIHEEIFSKRPQLINLDVFGFLDCCHAGTIKQPRGRPSLVICASGPLEYSRARNSLRGGLSFTQKFGGVCRMVQGTGVPTVTAEKLFDLLVQEHQAAQVARPLLSGANQPDPAPLPRLLRYGGTRPIAFNVRKRERTSISALSQGSTTSPTRIPHPTRTQKHILVQLTLDGEPNAAIKTFKEAIAELPAEFQVKIADAYETSRSALVLVRMTWEAWAVLTMAIDLKFVGLIIGKSLIHDRDESARDVPKVGENIPFHHRGRKDR